MICKMAAGGLQQIVTEVVDSLGNCLKAEQKQAILSFVEGKGVFVSLPTSHEVTATYRTTNHCAIITFLCHN